MKAVKIGQLKEIDLEKFYQAYYLRENARQADQLLAEKLFSLSRQSWPI